MKLLIRRSDKIEQDYIFCMANIRGDYVKVPHKLKFSFFFSPKVGHGIRVKPLFNPKNINISDAGNLWIHGKYKYIPSKRDAKVDSKDVDEMKAFFRYYKVLFAAVWESVVNPNDVVYFFKGDISFSELLSRFYDYENRKRGLTDVSNCSELEEYVRKTKWFNMND